MKNPFHCFVCTLNVTTLSLVIVLSYTLTVTALKSADIRNHLGTRTPYRYKFNKDDSRISFPNCKDTKIWMVLRHGTRLPSAKDIVRMNTTLKDLRMDIILHNRKGKGTLNYEQLHWFENWDSDIPLGQEKYLVLEGQDEMILIAERMQKRFPNAIQNKYNNSTFMFRYTATQRTQQSARYFTVGLFDKKHSQHVYFEPVLKVDTTLRFYKHCDRWQKQVKKNPDTFKEVSLFGQSKEMNDTLLSVSKRLGLDRALTLDEVILMYRVCGYEISWHKYTTSPWCFGFDEKSIKVLEYYDDLKKYWVDGYAHSQQAACMVMKNMFDSMRTADLHQMISSVSLSYCPCEPSSYFIFIPLSILSLLFKNRPSANQTHALRVLYYNRILSTFCMIDQKLLCLKIVMPKKRYLRPSWSEVGDLKWRSRRSVQDLHAGTAQRTVGDTYNVYIYIF
ncbi:multiple inositol polyphosphate phosphatase 1-like isoform X1 [Maniola hyperantus]|uniref:multiple inositol polyphosphate phosphatase 1-like isoform X1 n=1 Tax=Aphantopus hyperantus TaxID=2795564 RepID=UPI00374A0E16